MLNDEGQARPSASDVKSLYDHIGPLSGAIFFFNDTATPEIYTLSLHDALPICQLVEQEGSSEAHTNQRGFDSMVGCMQSCSRFLAAHGRSSGPCRQTLPLYTISLGTKNTTACLMMRARRALVHLT